MKKKLLSLLSLLIITSMMMGCGLNKIADKVKDNVDVEVTQGPDVETETNTESDTESGTLDNAEVKDNNTDNTEDNKDTTEPESTKTESTDNSEVTSVPSELPTVEELISDARLKDYKVSLSLSYYVVGQDIEMRVYSESQKCGLISYERNDSYSNYMGEKNEERTEVYYKDIPTDDEDTFIRTEYKKTEAGWESSTYAYIDESDGADLTMFEFMEGATVTHDDKYYIITGKALRENLDAFSMFGLEDAQLDTNVCTAKFDINTKEPVLFEISIPAVETEIEGLNVKFEDFITKVERVYSAVEIPREALESESNSDSTTEITVNRGENNEVVIKENEAKPEWLKYYDSYTSDKGTFLMWDNKNKNDIPVTLYGEENWYFDDSYNYTTYLVVNDPSIETEKPAYYVSYGDSNVDLSKTSAEIREALLEEDFNEGTTEKDIVEMEFFNRQCLVLVIDESAYTKYITVYQDAGFDSYVSIDIETRDMNSSLEEIVSKFVINVDSLSWN